MRALVVMMFLMLGLGGCSVVDAGASVVGAAADVTGSAVSGTIDVVTYPFSDSDDDEDD